MRVEGLKWVDWNRIQKQHRKNAADLYFKISLIRSLFVLNLH